MSMRNCSEEPPWPPYRELKQFWNVVVNTGGSQQIFIYGLKLRYKASYSQGGVDKSTVSHFFFKHCSNFPIELILET